MEWNGSAAPLESAPLYRDARADAPDLKPGCAITVRVTSALTALAGLAALSGWVLGVDGLKTLGFGTDTLRANAAIGFILIGLSLWFHVRARQTWWRRAAMYCTASVAALLGAATLAEYLLGSDLRIDELFFVDNTPVVQPVIPGFAPGRPAPAVAAAFLMIALALFALQSQRAAARWLAQALLIVPLLVSLVAFLGFAFGIETAFNVPPRVAMAQPAAALFIIICVGVLYARQDFEIMAPVLSPNLGGMLARKLLPAILLLPVLNWLWLQGEYQGRYGREFGVALSSVTAIVFLLGAVWWNARSLNLVDLKRKRAEDAVRESERIYRAIGESINYGVWLCDKEGRNIYVSPSFLNLVGLTQEECAEFGWGRVLHPDDAERTIAAWKECVRTSGTWDIEHRFRGVDGGWHAVLARGVPVRDADGAIVCWAGINLDIGRIKVVEHKLQSAFDDLDVRIQERTKELTTVNEKLRRSLEEKEVLLKEVHHRVKNNLQVVSSLLHLQSLHTQDQASMEMFHESQNRVRSMALVHERLYRSNNLAQVDFTDYIQGVANSLFQSYGVDSGRIGLAINVGKAPLSVDTAVPCGLVINELVSNCLKHAFTGRTIGQIRIDLVGVTETDMLLCVADDGIGLPPEIEPESAESFGMQVIVALVEQMHGRLQVMRGAGTEFRILFPNATSDGP